MGNIFGRNKYPIRSEIGDLPAKDAGATAKLAHGHDPNAAGIRGFSIGDTAVESWANHDAVVTGAREIRQPDEIAPCGTAPRRRVRRVRGQQDSHRRSGPLRSFAVEEFPNLL